MTQNENDTDVPEEKREKYIKAMQELAEAELEEDDRPDERGDGMPVGSPPPEVL